VFPPSKPAPTVALRPGNRWVIATLLATITALSYLDRQAFPAVARVIQTEIAIDDHGFAWMTTVFLWSYALMYAVGGRVIDVVGTRLGYTIMIAWWSLSNLCIGFATSLLGLGIFRACLGLGEGGGFPASGKAVAEWFPPEERSLAFGLFNAGSAIGAVIAVPVLTFIAHAMGWRMVFYLSGGAGLAMAIVWYRHYRLPKLPPGLPGKIATVHSYDGLTFGAILRQKQLLGLILAKALTDSAWFFLTAWLPRYLGENRGFDLKAMGSLAWIPYACAALGSLSGGAFGTILIARGASINRARKLSLLVSAGMMPCALFIHSASVNLVIVLFGTCLFAHQFWSANVQTLAADLFPSRLVGSVEGLIGCAGAASAGVFQLVAADLVQRHGYGIPFLFCGVVHMIALAAILIFVGRITQPTT
jgi:MFS transporter, ACS family, hexuronate transporter